MHSKTSRQQNLLFPWKAVSGFSEETLREWISTFVTELRIGDRIVLEGALGVGKSTWARLILLALGVTQPPEGSPTFAIAHEYRAPLGEIVHLDFYRIRSEEEINEAGIPSYFWERSALVLAEWLSCWPDFERQVLMSGRIWKIQLDFHPEDSQLRNAQIFKSR